MSNRRVSEWGVGGPEESIRIKGNLEGEGQKEKNARKGSAKGMTRVK